MLYALMIFLAVFGGGGMIRMYGETCGLSPTDPSTWFRSFMLIGSPWCRFLNWGGHLSSGVMEYIWYHMGAVMLGWVGTKLPINIGTDRMRINDKV